MSLSDWRLWRWLQGLRERFLGYWAERPKGRLRRHRFRVQLRRHSVALVSLLFAASSLAYNTWRNETSELHRNWRQAAFDLTHEVNELQQIVLYRRYFHTRSDEPVRGPSDADTWIRGWGKAAGVRDLTSVLPEPLPKQGVQLHAAWQEHAGDLDADGELAQTAEHELLDAIDAVRGSVLGLIQELR
jgi:hypothetical protein